MAVRMPHSVLQKCRKALRSDNIGREQGLQLIIRIARKNVESIICESDDQYLQTQRSNEKVKTGDQDLLYPMGTALMVRFKEEVDGKFFSRFFKGLSFVYVYFL